MAKLLSGLSYANVMATIAVFLALGGGAYAAMKLPRKSVGSPQLKANAVNSAKVKNRSLRAVDFKAGQLPSGPAGDRGAQGSPGPKGDQGAPCPSSDPVCRGPKGDAGDRGPGTLTFDGQFDRDDAYHLIATVNGLDVKVLCSGTSGDTRLVISSPTQPDPTFIAWGTKWDGTSLDRAARSGGAGAVDSMTVFGNTTAELDVVAKTAHDSTPGYTRFDLSAIAGGKCNYHALMIPPS
jgi:hypothetical protein